MSTRSERTLEGFVLDLRKPSYESQKAALEAGYGSVRDWALDKLVDDVLELTQRVEALEEKLPLQGEIVEGTE